MEYFIKKRWLIEYGGQYDEIIDGEIVIAENGEEAEKKVREAKKHLTGLRILAVKKL